MPKYENGVIYKLCHCNDLENENIYIGSTTNFRTRKNKHKSNCNNEKAKGYNLFVYQYIRDNGNWDEWKMIPIEVYPCNGKEELKIRERYHIELLKSKLNKQIPTRTIKEWYKDNKEILAEKKKQYREDNKEKIAEQRKQYRNNNKQNIAEKKKEYYQNNKEHKAKYDKKYRIDNKEKRDKNAKEFYENNKEIINEKRKEKVICDNCGCDSTKSNLKRHQQTNKCKNYNITIE